MSEFFGPDLTKLEYTIKEFLRENNSKYIDYLRSENQRKNYGPVVIVNTAEKIVSDFNNKYETCLSLCEFNNYANEFVLRNSFDVLLFVGILKAARL